MFLCYHPVTTTITINRLHSEQEKGANPCSSHIMEPRDLKASRSPAQSRLQHPLCPTSLCLQKPQSLGAFRNSQQLLRLGKETPGPKPALGRAAEIKGGCSEELNAGIPQWCCFRGSCTWFSPSRCFGQLAKGSGVHPAAGTRKARDSHSQPLPWKLSVGITAPKGFMSLF